jgi:transcriptional regulator NrdR family protein
MICQFCFNDDGHHFSRTEVLETRQYLDPASEMIYNQRRRQCLSCDARFNTVERVVEDD